MNIQVFHSTHLTCRHGYHSTKIVFCRFFSKRSSDRKCNYDVLGLAPHASQADIKNAYYEKSKQYHPDRNKEPGAGQKFQEISTAYEILSNEESRSDYDLSRGYSQRKAAQNYSYQAQQRERKHNPEEFTIYTRNIYRRMKHKEYQKAKAEAKADNHANKFYDFDNDLKSRFKKEQQFYESLNEELKRKYEEYYFKQKQEEQTEQETIDGENQTIESPNSRLLIVFTFAIMLILFMSFTDVKPPQQATNKPILKSKDK